MRLCPLSRPRSQADFSATLLVASGDLTEKDLAYLNLRDNIEIGNESGEWRVDGEKSHHTYEEVNVVLKEILGAEGNVLKDEVAYDNYYARPAEYGSGLNAVELDQQPAADKFRTLWLEGNQKPDVALIASANAQHGMAANGLGEDVLRAHGIEPIYTNHPLARKGKWLRNRRDVIESLRDAWLK